MDPDSFPNRRERARLVAGFTLNQRADCIHFIVGHFDKFTPTGYKSHQAGNSQYLDEQFGICFHAHKCVAGKERRFDQLGAVTPLASLQLHGCKRLEAFVAERRIDSLLALIARLQGIPCCS